jgi:hypothetical protein
MQKKILSLVLSLLVVGALAALAQSPTTSAPTGNNSTQEPYGATLDHPNPNSGSSTATNPASSAPAPASDSSMNNSSSSTTSSTTTSGSTTGDSNASPTATDSTTTTSTDSASPATANSNNTLPRTASDLPLLCVLALMALSGAFLVRTVARRNI